MASSSFSTAQALEGLVERLREIRINSGLTARALAQRAGWHDHSKISKIEHRKQRPTPADIRTWCNYCGASEEAADLVASLHAVESMYVEWRRLQPNGLRHHQELAIPLYERTREFRIYEAEVIPGLFQTFEYAKFLLEIFAKSLPRGDDVEQAATSRVKRQRVLLDANRRFSFVLEEVALRTSIGNTQIMQSQLEKISTIAALPNVMLGIVPMVANRSILPSESFWIFDQEKVHIELTTAELTITQPREIAMYSKAFIELSEMAAYGAKARDLVDSAIKSFRSVA